MLDQLDLSLLLMGQCQPHMIPMQIEAQAFLEVSFILKTLPFAQEFNSEG